jgi:hypothetical protein
LNIANTWAQDTIKKNPTTFSGYIETYYSYDFGKPSNHERPPFFYSFNRHNEVNINLAFLKASYKTGKVRGNLALMTGTYPQYNLAGEQGLLKNIFEGNAGVKLSQKKNLWLDAGIIPSHIGFESAIGGDCWNLTRSLLAENSPYYEAGVKIGFTSTNEKIYLAGLVLNGWQRIQRIPYNNTPAFGTQFTYKPNSKNSFNWSTYIGNEQPDTAKKWRYFNNLYANFQLTKKWGLIAGFDVGLQQKRKKSSIYNIWYSPVIIGRYGITEKFKLSARAEYYSDESGIIIFTGTQNGFKTFGYSLNLDYSPTENTLIRIEGRGLNSKDRIFEQEKTLTHANYFLTTSLSISF